MSRYPLVVLLAIGFVVVVVLAIIGAAGHEGPQAPEIPEGTVTDKAHEPARQWTQIVMVNNIPIVIIHHDDEDWIFRLENCAENPCEKETAYVSATTYDKYKVGDHYKADSASVSEDSVEKTDKK